MAIWQCIKHCGACCHLEPSDRPELPEYLTAAELELYLSMVGEGGWCINYNQERRQCQIYEQRPPFCRVLPETFEQMYGVPKEEFNDFAIDCCHQQIEAVYGEDSLEMQAYQQQVG